MCYIYQADIYCDNCGNSIRQSIKQEELEHHGMSESDFDSHYDDERNYDSDQYPKSAGDDEESDSPQHCGSGETCINAEILPSGQKIGCLIGTNLTSDGVEYLREAIRKGGEVAEFWKSEFSDYLPRLEDEELDETIPAPVPDEVLAPDQSTEELRNPD